MSHFGLKTIFTSEKEITKDNIISIIENAMPIFLENQKQIIELKEIFVGDQEILQRQNDKTSTNEKFNINILPTIVNTMAGLYLGEKIDYVYANIDADDKKKEDIAIINRYMRYSGDILCDKNALIEMLISGIAYQFCAGDEEEPFMIANIPSENCFAIYNTNIGYPIIATCVYSSIDNDNYTLTVFTKTDKIVLVTDKDGKLRIDIENSMPHECPKNPIQVIKFNEYALSLVAQLESVQNAFNLAISDSINAIIEQIRAMLVINGAEITKDDAKLAKETGVLNVTNPNGTPISTAYLSKPLDENINSLRTFLFDLALFMAGVPSQETGGSGNNGAVAMASGFFGANISAYFNELEFQKPKQNQIDNAIEALKRKGIIKSDISSFDIQIRFDRNKLSSLKENADALAVLLKCNIPPRDALKVAGIFSDADNIANEMENIKKTAINKIVDEVTKDEQSTQNQMS